MNKILYHTIQLHCATEHAFKMFTENEHVQKWLTEVADIEPKVGGKYELFWNPEDRENDSTIGCTITAIEPNKFLAFEWKGPQHYKHFMNDADPLTHVVVFFISSRENKRSETATEVHLIHSGWRSSPEWEEARLYFEKAWNDAFDRLRIYINKSH
ncbi:MAG: SRPBCC domain-containing protein [candidate division WOR-3 bacterium]|nr:MAG: SRPBCC domain-containing protein [candidate division WOR-3 bacterium]